MMGRKHSYQSTRIAMPKDVSEKSNLFRRAAHGLFFLAAIRALKKRIKEALRKRFKERRKLILQPMPISACAVGCSRLSRKRKKKSTE